ncbi:MAG: class I SAM-dependent methyltransferase [Dehalococcoidia bacterium]
MPNQDRGHKWFAALFDRIMASAERSFMKRVRRDITGGAKGRVLEIGCGTGANFPYYSDQADEVIATEPDPYMLERARKKADTARRPLEIRQASAEELPFPDSSFDTVVSTLNMCSIPHPDRALAEIKRILKPSGEYRFYDHVRYGNAFGAFWQDLIAPVWGWLGAGCHPNRDIAAFIRDAGFELERLESSKPLPPIPPMLFSRPHILGVARPA